MRRSAGIAAVLIFGLALAGCGGGSESPDETPEAPEETTTDETPEADGGNLTIWVDETRATALASTVEQFEEDTGATVELVDKNFDDIRPDFLAQVPTGEGPDLTVGAHDWLGELTANGVVEPIELGDLASELSEAAVAAFTYDGQVYGLPYSVENLALIRNDDIVDETPDTWDDLLDQVEDLDTEYPFLIQVGEEGDPYTMYPFQTTFGAPVFEQDADGSYTTELALGGDEGLEFAEFLRDMGDRGIFDTAITYDVALEAFSNGESPYIVGGPWMIDDFKQAELSISIHEIPPAGDNPAQPFAGVQGFYLNSKSENKLLAMEFMTEYVASVEAQLAIYEAGNRPPALVAAAEQISSDPIVQGFGEVGATAAPMPAIPEMGSVWAFWGVTEAAIISGAQEPEAAWQGMVTNIEDAIAGG